MKDKFAIRDHAFSTYAPYDRFLKLLPWVGRKCRVIVKKLLKEWHQVSMPIWKYQTRSAYLVHCARAHRIFFKVGCHTKM